MNSIDAKANAGRAQTLNSLNVRWNRNWSTWFCFVHVLISCSPCDAPTSTYIRRTQHKISLWNSSVPTESVNERKKLPNRDYQTSNEKRISTCYCCQFAIRPNRNEFEFFAHRLNQFLSFVALKIFWMRDFWPFAGTVIVDIALFFICRFTFCTIEFTSLTTWPEQANWSYSIVGRSVDAENRLKTNKSTVISDESKKFSLSASVYKLKCVRRCLRSIAEIANDRNVSKRVSSLMDRESSRI